VNLHGLLRGNDEDFGSGRALGRERDVDPASIYAVTNDLLPTVIDWQATVANVGVGSRFVALIHASIYVVALACWIPF
jgi:hypothetical protein